MILDEEQEEMRRQKKVAECITPCNNYEHEDHYYHDWLKWVKHMCHV